MTAMRSISTPGTMSAARQPSACSTPSDASAMTMSGMIACVAPPPALPQPAAVAFAVPTMFGANITDVWNCVTTNEAPIAPMHSRQNRNAS